MLITIVFQPLHLSWPAHSYAVIGHIRTLHKSRIHPIVPWLQCSDLRSFLHKIDKWGQLCWNLDLFFVNSNSNSLSLFSIETTSSHFVYSLLLSIPFILSRLFIIYFVLFMIFALFVSTTNLSCLCIKQCYLFCLCNVGC